MTIQEMKIRKRELGYTNKMVAELGGIPLGTVQKIFAGMTKSPRRETVLALQAVLGTGQREAQGNDRKVPGATLRREDQDCFYDDRQVQRIQALKEETASYDAGSSARKLPEKKRCTIDDYYALPDDRRAELIDGVFYDMAAPTQLHQALLGQLYLHFAACVADHPECELFFAPLDVRLDDDNYTMVQPDLLIVCDRKDTDIRRINGAPDFIIEILSPTNRAHDLFRKLAKYQHARVREYWIVDPQRQKVVVYDLENDELPALFSFHDTIPVIISGGKCSIDFDAITRRIERYLQET